MHTEPGYSGQLEFVPSPLSLSETSSATSLANLLEAVSPGLPFSADCTSAMFPTAQSLPALPGMTGQQQYVPMKPNTSLSQSAPAAALAFAANMNALSLQPANEPSLNELIAQLGQPASSTSSFVSRQGYSAACSQTPLSNFNLSPAVSSGADFKPLFQSTSSASSLAPLATVQQSFVPTTNGLDLADQLPFSTVSTDATAQSLAFASQTSLPTLSTATSVMAPPTVSSLAEVPASPAPSTTSSAPRTFGSRVSYKHFVFFPSML